MAFAAIALLALAAATQPALAASDVRQQSVFPADSVFPPVATPAPAASFAAAPAPAPAPAADPTTATTTTTVPPVRLRIASVVTSTSQAYSWSVNLTASRLLVPVAVGPNNGFAQVAYTAAFTRTRADGFTYTLSGAVALWSGDGVAHVVDVPTVTVVTSAGNTVALPAGAVNCPALTVPTTGELTCTFSGSVTMAQEPVPGSVSATATVPGVSLPFVMRSGSARYDFSVAERADVGSTAVVGNYFESGAGLLQPYGVSGEQPPPGLTLEDSRTFTFTALYGEIPVSACQQSATWTAINTAELRPGAGLGGGLAGPALSETQQQRLQQAQANVTLNLVGCDNFAAGTAATSPAPAFAGVDSSTAAAPTTPAAVPAPVPAAAAAGDDSHFVSAVCWSKRHGTLLAGNSAGHIKVLQLI